MSEIKASLILEIMGRPAGHIKEALNTLVIKMGGEEGVELIDKKYHEPKPIKDTKDLFTCFAEVNVKFDSLERFFAVIMGYMPSNVEVYEPDKFRMETHEINSLGNFITSKLHRYDEIVKRVMTERDILFKQLQYLRQGGKIEDLIKTEEKFAKSIEKAKGKPEDTEKDTKKTKRVKKDTKNKSNKK